MMIKQNPKIIVFCAPSGSGKTTIAKAVVNTFSDTLEFSISAATRAMRGNEKNGVDYYFLTLEDFKKKIENNEFAEWVLVYPAKSYYYGTLRSEIERISKKGKIAVTDIDVKGAQKIKDIYGDNALVIFIKAPIDQVKKRLEERKTDSPEDIAIRLARIPEELTYEKKFDVVVENIVLEEAIKKAKKIVSDFLHKSD